MKAKETDSATGHEIRFLDGANVQKNSIALRTRHQNQYVLAKKKGGRSKVVEKQQPHIVPKSCRPGHNE